MPDWCRRMKCSLETDRLPGAMRSAAGFGIRCAEPPRGAWQLLFGTRGICFRGRRWRGGLSRGRGIPKFWWGQTVAGPKLGPLDCSHELAGHWCFRLCLLQRLATMLGCRGLSQGRYRKANDRGKDQQSPHRHFPFAFSPSFDQAADGFGTNSAEPDS
jgi:hypothetical protein